MSLTALCALNFFSIQTVNGQAPHFINAYTYEVQTHPSDKGTFEVYHLYKRSEKFNFRRFYRNLPLTEIFHQDLAIYVVRRFDGYNVMICHTWSSKSWMFNGDFAIWINENNPNTYGTHTK